MAFSYFRGGNQCYAWRARQIRHSDAGLWKDWWNSSQWDASWRGCATRCSYCHQRVFGEDYRGMLLLTTCTLSMTISANSVSNSPIAILVTSNFFVVVFFRNKIYYMYNLDSTSQILWSRTSQITSLKDSSSIKTIQKKVNNAHLRITYKFVLFVLFLIGAFSLLGSVIWSKWLIKECTLV